MKHIIVFLLISSIYVSISCQNKKFKQVISYNKPSISLTERIDSIITCKMNEYNIPGLSIGIVKNDTIIYTKGYGVASINSYKKITEVSIFHTASVSKIFTALAVMNLIQNNKLALDEKLVSVLPELKFSDKRAEAITIKHLLNHTSGIPDVSDYNWSNNNQEDNSLKDYLKKQNFKLKFQPSSQYSYSNLAYDILGYVIKKSSGIKFEDYVKENILLPSGMTNSDFRIFKISDSLRTFPHSKSWITRNVYQRNVYPYTREHAPSSTLNSSSLELSKWMVHFIKKLNFGPESFLLNSMTKKSTNVNNFIGLGFQLYDLDGKKAIGHYGGDKGYRSYLLIVPENKIGLIVLANCDYNEDFRQEILYQIVKEINKG